MPDDWRNERIGRDDRSDRDGYADAVLEVVRSIPTGRVMSYSGIADYLAEVWRTRSPRLVGHVMARCGPDVPWHRVVQASGRPVRGLEDEALSRLRAERTTLNATGQRVDMRRAAWAPELPPRRPTSKVPPRRPAPELSPGRPAPELPPRRPGTR